MILKDRVESGEVGNWRDKGDCPDPTRGGCLSHKNPVPFIAKHSFWNKCRNKTELNWVTHVHKDNGR